MANHSRASKDEEIIAIFDNEANESLVKRRCTSEDEKTIDTSDASSDVPLAKRRCIQPVSSKSDNELDADKWTLTEKKQLFNALVKYGSNDLDILARHIPTRSKSAVLNYVLYLERTARLSLKDNSGKKNAARQAPIDMWIQYVCQMSLNDDYKLMDISRALKFITLFEERSDESKIDIRDCYEVLSTCLSGNAPKHMNPESSRYLAEKLQKLAMTTKMKRNIKENKFVSGLPQRKEGRSYRSKKQIEVENKEESSFITNKVINPLKIPKDLLTFEEIK